MRTREYKFDISIMFTLHMYRIFCVEKLAVISLYYYDYMSVFALTKGIIQIK